MSKLFDRWLMCWLVVLCLEALHRAGVPEFNVLTASGAAAVFAFLAWLGDISYEKARDDFKRWKHERDVRLRNRLIEEIWKIHTFSNLKNEKNETDSDESNLQPEISETPKERAERLANTWDRLKKLSYGWDPRHDVDDLAAEFGDAADFAVAKALDADNRQRGRSDAADLFETRPKGFGG